MKVYEARQYQEDKLNVLIYENGQYVSTHRVHGTIAHIRQSISGLTWEDTGERRNGFAWYRGHRTDEMTFADVDRIYDEIMQAAGR